MQYSQVRVWEWVWPVGSKYGLWNPRRNLTEDSHNFPFFFNLAYTGWQECAFKYQWQRRLSIWLRNVIIVPFSYLFDQIMRMSGDIFNLPPRAQELVAQMFWWVALRLFSSNGEARRGVSHQQTLSTIFQINLWKTAQLQESCVVQWIP